MLNDNTLLLPSMLCATNCTHFHSFYLPRYGRLSAALSPSSNAPRRISIQLHLGHCESSSQQSWRSTCQASGITRPKEPQKVEPSFLILWEWAISHPNYNYWLWTSSLSSCSFYLRPSYTKHPFSRTTLLQIPKTPCLRYPIPRLHRLPHHSQCSRLTRQQCFPRRHNVQNYIQIVPHHPTSSICGLHPS